MDTLELPAFSPPSRSKGAKMKVEIEVSKRLIKQCNSPLAYMRKSARMRLANIVLLAAIKKEREK